MGKSASGKDTIYKRLLEEVPFPLETVVLYTTRPIRQGETNGVEYFFVTEEEYTSLSKQGKVIECREYQTVHGIWRYFTVLDGQINLEQKHYITINTLDGYRQIRHYFGKDMVVPIYIEVEDGVRLGRALQREQAQREPKYAELCRRFLADTEDFSEETLNILEIKKRYQNIEMERCIKDIILDLQQYCSDTVIH